MTNFRGFIAIDIGSFPKLVEFENEIKKTGADVKLVDPNIVHITLKFLGDTEENLVEKIEEIMKNSVEEIKPFEMQLAGTGVFPDQKYMRVVWIGIKNGEQIGKIASKIEEQVSKLGFEKENREFSAHLTIGRIRSAKNKEKLLRVIENYKNTNFGSYKVDSIKLKKSELTPKGPIYTTLKEVKL